MSCAIKVILSKNNMPSYKGDFLHSSATLWCKRETIVESEPGTMLHLMFMCDIAPECFPLPPYLSTDLLVSSHITAGRQNSLFLRVITSLCFLLRSRI